MTRDEKLAAIQDYAEDLCWKNERDTLARYLWAVYRCDAEKVAYFEQFGDRPRQIVLNVRTYERGLTTYGMTEMRFDDCGWLRSFLPIIQEIDLSPTDRIEIGQGKNGRFAIAVSMLGGGHCVSVWDEPIESYDTAIRTAIGYIEKNCIERLSLADKDPCNNPKKHLRKILAEVQKLKRQYFSPVQLSMF